eukprot:scaffold30742_cov36-Prasinocladus_malaysianus.AAC.1
MTNSDFDMTWPSHKRLYRHALIEFVTTVSPPQLWRRHLQLYMKSYLITAAVSGPRGAVVQHDNLARPRPHRQGFRVDRNRCLKRRRRSLHQAQYVSKSARRSHSRTRTLTLPERVTLDVTRHHSVTSSLRDGSHQAPCCTSPAERRGGTWQRNAKRLVFLAVVGQHALAGSQADEDGSQAGDGRHGAAVVTQ